MFRAPTCMLILTGSLLLDTAAALGGVGIPPLTTMHIAGGFSRPVFATSPAGDAARLFIVEQRGSQGIADRADIRIVNLATGTINSTPFLSITGLTTGPEQGLLGLAFHSNFAANGYFYVNFTTTGGGTAGRTIIRRYRVLPSNPNLADESSALQIMAYDQPFSQHNGGWMDFGPEGYLYISTGDGGSAFDPLDSAQDITSDRLGKILRIDVNSDSFPTDPSQFFSDPSTNPFLVSPGDNEIWAFGLRNPWRCSFDRATGDLWIADVGQGEQEEIDFQPANAPGSWLGMPGYQGGKNYGWRCLEGLSCTGLSGCSCQDPTLAAPLYRYVHGGGGAAVIGGYVYRGCALPALRGTYFFSDYSLSRIWTFTLSEGVVTNFADRTDELAPPSPYVIGGVTSFGEDSCGELYICTASGDIFKIVAAGTPTNPADLNSDGMVDGVDLALLLGGWGACRPGGPCVADIDHDGQVNGLDLAALLVAWTD